MPFLSFASVVAMPHCKKKNKTYYFLKEKRTKVRAAFFVSFPFVSMSQREKTWRGLNRATRAKRQH